MKYLIAQHCEDDKQGILTVLPLQVCDSLDLAMRYVKVNCKYVTNVKIYEMSRPPLSVRTLNGAILVD